MDRFEERARRATELRRYPPGRDLIGDEGEPLAEAKEFRLTRLEPRFDKDGQPVPPPTKALFREVHAFFLARRWPPKSPGRPDLPEVKREPWRRHLPAGVDHPAAIEGAKTAYKRHQLRQRVYRKIADFFRLHLSCNRKACRRARACATPDAECFHVVLPCLQECFYPWFLPSLHESVARDQAEREMAEAAEEALAGSAQANSQPSAAGVNSTAAAVGARRSNIKEGVMSKGRDRPGKEKRKPKADKNKKKKGIATPPPGGVKPTVAIAVPKS